MAYLFSLSGDYPSLARAEIEAFFGTTTTLLPSLVLLEKKDITFTLFSRLGLTKQVSRILLDTINKDELLSLRLENSYKIILHRQDACAPSTKEIADLLFQQQTQPVVDLHSPQHIYHLFWFAKRIILAEEIYTQGDALHHRRSHLKTYNHPTSIHPKLARAMINLSGQDSFIDPFCGAGGMVIEGALMGLSAQGSDINSFLIARAKENAQEQGLMTNLFNVADALALSLPCPAIVTDLPYGKNSSLSQPIDVLYHSFFMRAQELTSTLVIGTSASVALQELVATTRWEIKQQFTLYVHKSLTRVISVLEQKE